MTLTRRQALIGAAATMAAAALPASKLSEDEELARRLQAEEDAEAAKCGRACVEDRARLTQAQEPRAGAGAHAEG